MEERASRLIYNIQRCLFKRLITYLKPEVWRAKLKIFCLIKKKRGTPMFKLFRKYKRKYYKYRKKIMILLATIGIGTLLGVCGSREDAINTIKQALGLEILEADESNNLIEQIGSIGEKNTLKDENASGEMEIHFIDVGQGDATLIICDGESMLIDAGDNDKGTLVQNYLKKRNITNIKYLILTHPDADHIGGADVIITKFECENIFMSGCKSDSNTYRDVIDAMSYKGNEALLANVGQSYALGSAKFTIIAPNRDYEDTNNSSIGIMLQHGENSFIFTGDAEEVAEGDILNSGQHIQADVYQVGHHGSKSSSSIDFLRVVNPKYAVISCGENNKYGHPHAATLNNLRAMDVKVFRTDEQGSIIVTSDGKTLKWNCSPSETWKAGN